MTEKLGKNTTHSVSRSIAPKTGNPTYRKLKGLFEEELISGGLAGVLCATIALVHEDAERVLDKKEGSKYTYGDTSIENLSQPLFYTVRELYEPETNELSKLSKFIDHELIPTGFEIILNSNANELCDLMIKTLKKIN